MGKTSQPLIIWVEAELEGDPDIQDLATKGHTIVPMADDVVPDLILHRHAHRWEKAYKKMLPVVLTQARRRKKAAKA
jgi:hypothetical protein